MRRLTVLALAAALFTPAAAFAASCDDTVVAESGLIDVGKVTTAARGLPGATVRVRVVKDAGAKTIDFENFIHRLERECPSWMNGSKHQSNLVFVPFSVAHGDIKFITGSAINARLSEAEITQIYTKLLVPKWQKRKSEPNALNEGLVATFDAMKLKLAAPIGGGGNINYSPPSDNSGLWKILGWALFGCFILFVVYLAATLLPRLTRDRGSVKSAQTLARAARSKCIGLLNELGNKDTMTELSVAAHTAEDDLTPAQVLKIRNDIAEFGRLVRAANAAFAAFDDLRKDPIVDGLNEAAYETFEAKYQDILVQQLEPAKALAEKIKDPARQAYKAAA